jgi:hypothetical protein
MGATSWLKPITELTDNERAHLLESEEDLRAAMMRHAVTLMLVMTKDGDGGERRRATLYELARLAKHTFKEIDTYFAALWPAKVRAMTGELCVPHGSGGYLRPLDEALREGEEGKIPTMRGVTEEHVRFFLDTLIRQRATIAERLEGVQFKRSRTDENTLETLDAIRSLAHQVFVEGAIKREGEKR